MRLTNSQALAFVETLLDSPTMAAYLNGVLPYRISVHNIRYLINDPYLDRDLIRAPVADTALFVEFLDAIINEMKRALGIEWQQNYAESNQFPSVNK